MVDFSPNNKSLRICSFLIVFFLLGVGIPCHAMVGVPDGDEFIPSSVFNSNMAVFAAKVSSDIYNDNGKHALWLTQNGISSSELIEFGDSSSTALSSLQAVISHKLIQTASGSKNLYVVAFRGTRGFPADLGIDFRFVGQKFNSIQPEYYGNSAVSVHAGIFQATASMIDKELTTCSPNCSKFIDVIHETAATEAAGGTSNNIFFITGHSLGGAIATLYSTHLFESGIPSANIMTYTFGAPAIGEHEFKVRYDNPVGNYLHRIRNLPDPVPHAAFMWEHIGIEHVFSGNRKLTFPGYANSPITTSIAEDLLPDGGFLVSVINRLNNHKMAVYLDSIEAYHSSLIRLEVQPHFKDFLATASAEDINRYMYLLALKDQLLNSSSANLKLERIDKGIKLVNAAFDILGWASQLGKIKEIPNPGQVMSLARGFEKSEDVTRAIMVLSIIADSMTQGFPEYSSGELLTSKSVLQKFADLSNATAVNEALDSYIGQTLVFVVSKTLDFAFENASSELIWTTVTSPKKLSAAFNVGLKMSKKLRASYFAEDIAKIVIHLGAATWVTNISESIGTKLIATEFLDHYLRTYRGDLSAMMEDMGVSIGKGKYGVKDLDSVFMAYTRQKNAQGGSLRQFYGQTDWIDYVLDGGYDEAAAINLVRDLLLEHAPLTFKVITPTSQTILGRGDNVQPGQSLSRMISLDPLLMFDGYTVNSLNLEHVGINNVSTPLGPTTATFNQTVNPEYPHPAQYYYKVVAALQAPDDTPVNVGTADTILPAYYITDYGTYCTAGQISVNNLTATSFTLNAENQLTIGLQVPSDFLSCNNSTLALGERLNLQTRIKSISPWGEVSILTDWQSATLTSGQYPLTLTFPVKNYKALLDEQGALGDYQLELEVGHGDLEETTLRIQNLLLNYADLGNVPALGSPYMELVIANAGQSSVDVDTGLVHIQVAAGEEIVLILHNQSQYSIGETLTIALLGESGMVNLTGTLAADGGVAVTIPTAGSYSLHSVGNPGSGYVMASAQPILVRTVEQTVASGTPICPPGKHCIASPPSFTKLDVNGNDLDDSATQWSCVRDNRTNLIWEVKTDDDGLRDKDWTYSWYSSDATINGGVPGTVNGGSCDNTIDCDTEGYAVRTNQVELCGNYEWRLPRVEELATLIDHSRINHIDDNYFPSLFINGTPYYLSASSRADNTNSVYMAALDDFYSILSGGNKQSALPVWLVSSAQLSNLMPSANAGIDQIVDELTTVNLGGSGSDPDGIIINYQWAQVEGNPVVISNSSSPTASFYISDILVDEAYTFRLTVTDNAGAKGIDTVVITAINIEPTCDSNNLGLCTTNGDCTNAGGHWWSDNSTCFGIVTSASQAWMDRNLGATQVATSPTDSSAFGDLYQWGRGTDGHEKRSSGWTYGTSTTDTPGHSIILIPSGVGGQSPYDWRKPQNNYLWQGVNGANNPCPNGFRLPTETELEKERASWSTNSGTGAFASPLKLQLAGMRQKTPYNQNSFGLYWTSTPSGIKAKTLQLTPYTTNTGWGSWGRLFGASVRCIQD